MPTGPFPRVSVKGATLLLTAAGLVILAGLLAVLIPGWPPVARCASDACQEGRQWLSFAITGFVLLAGLFQYRQAQRWKRAEFLAQEMEAFLNKPTVRNALLMIDWGARHVNVLASDSKELKDWTLVTRRLQSRALLPHELITLKGSENASDTEDVSEAIERGDLGRFTLAEAGIRDCYDALLDGLERFGNYRKTGLVTVADLRPYLGYWIDDIASATTDAADGEWTCVLLSYIHYYKFEGVQALFQEFGHDIRPGSVGYRAFLAQVPTARREQLRVLFGL